MKRGANSVNSDYKGLKLLFNFFFMVYDLYEIKG